MSVSHVCDTCGKDDDLMVGLAGQTCGKCVRKKHKEVLSGKSKKKEHPYFKKW